MSKAAGKMNSKRAFEASMVGLPAARLRPAQRHSGDELNPPAEHNPAQDADSGLPALDVKPAVIERLIQILKDL